MAWQVLSRDDGRQGNDVPFVTLCPYTILFNAAFARIAELKAGELVTIYVDSENLKIAFEFRTEKSLNSFVLTQKPGTRGVSCSGWGLVQDYSWIRSVTKLARSERRFSASKEGKLWVIQLCPGFEERRARESANIPSDARGIYRYVRENGEIVYIGRGEIRKRLSRPDRQDWEFDQVEYSVVADPDQQVKWEDYWITRFRETNKGRLPIYNKISGSFTETDSEANNG